MNLNRLLQWVTLRVTHNLACGIEDVTIHYPSKGSWGRRAKKKALEGNGCKELGMHLAYYVKPAGGAVHVMMNAIKPHVQVLKEDGSPWCGVPWAKVCHYREDQLLSPSPGVLGRTKDKKYAKSHEIRCLRCFQRPSVYAGLRVILVKKSQPSPISVLVLLRGWVSMLPTLSKRDPAYPQS